MRFSLILVYFIFNLAGCIVHEQDTSISPVKIIETNASGVEVSLTGVYAEVPGGTYWCYFLPGSNTIRWTTLTGRNLPDTPLDQVPGIAPVPEGLFFYVYSIDSIFVFPHRGKNIYIINQKGALGDHWTIDAPLPSGITEYGLASLPGTPMVYQNNRLYILGIRRDINLRTPEEYKQYYSVSADLSIDLGQLPIVIHNKAGCWPVFFSSGLDWDETYPQRAIDMDGRVIYAFKSIPEVNVYENDSLIFSRQIRSKYFKMERKPYSEDSIGNLAYMRRYLVEQPSNIDIVADPYFQLYYRTIRDGGPFLDENGMVRFAVDNPWSIIVLNRTFQIIDEIRMDPQEWVPTLIPTREGLMIEQRRSNPDRDPLVFGLFQLKQP